MLLLAGLMSIMAVGGIAFLGDMLDAEPSSDETPEDSEPLTGSDMLNDMPNLILSGDDQANDIDGAAGDDQINGYAGDDVISGGDGDDVLLGADGDDTLIGNDGDDLLQGEDGRDTLSGSAGDDRLFGHNDDDTLSGGDGQDELHGGLGDDTLSGGAGDDALHGGQGDDRLQGGDGQDTLFGGWGDDWLSGLEQGTGNLDDVPETDPGSDVDFLNGGGGDDTIIAGEGDIVTAGDGEDTIVLGDWITEGQAVTLMDFDAQEDTLLVVFDQSANPDPKIEITTDPQAPGVSQILLDGSEIATIRSDAGLSAADIVLVDYADAPVLSLGS